MTRPAIPVGASAICPMRVTPRGELVEYVPVEGNINRLLRILAAFGGIGEPVANPDAPHYFADFHDDDGDLLGDPFTLTAGGVRYLRMKKLLRRARMGGDRG